MKVTILEPSGYCAGVEHAMKVAIETKDKNPSKSVVVLGMLVHNEDSLKSLEKRGIKTIYDKNCSLEQLVEKINEPSIVILTAHGHSKEVEEKLLKNGHQIVDATCPFVENSFSDIKKSLLKEFYVFYIGVKNHPESTAALSLSEKVLLIDVKYQIIQKIDFEEVNRAPCQSCPSVPSADPPGTLPRTPASASPSSHSGSASPHPHWKD